MIKIFKNTQEKYEFALWVLVFVVIVLILTLFGSNKEVISTSCDICL